MLPCLRFSITDYYPDASASERLPADCSHAVPYSQKRCWRGADWWVSEQTYDARHAYVYLIEVHTKRSLCFGVDCLRRDLRWLYPLLGEFAIHGKDGRVALRLSADEHVRILTGAGRHEVRLRPGRHLLFAFVLEWGWTRRYAKTALSYLRKPHPVPISPEIRGQLLTLASLPAQEGMVMDAEVYWPIARITQFTRQLYHERTTYGGLSPSLQLVNSARSHIRGVLRMAGKPPTVAEIAGHFRVSADHLSRLHKKHYGMGLQAFFIRQRLDAAYRLLSEEGWSVSAVTYQLGFSDVQAFNKLFRKYFGMAPSGVRKR